MPAENAAVLKVGVLRNDREAIVFGGLPDREVIRAAQAALVNMSGIWVKIA